MADRWHVAVDGALCVGSGMCAGTAPGAFTFDAARKSHPARAETDAADEVLAAAEGCPVEAIRITLAGSAEPVFPPGE
jgi:ferredoxin